MWVNAGGERFWVKYHFKTDQGIENFTDAEAKAMVSKDADYHLRDLYEAVARGEGPSWTLHMQVMPFEEAADYRFNPFDLTKIWPHTDYPLHAVGRLVLDRNPENYFLEVEQAAFEPSNLVPGIGPSPDKMLLGRLFSYPDTHRYRIGPNYLQLAVNAPKAPMHSYNTDGPMASRSAPDPVYAPNSMGGPEARERFADASWTASGEIVRAAYSKRRDDDDFVQAGNLYRQVLDEPGRERLVSNITGHLQNGVHGEVLRLAVDYWRNVDAELGARVAKAGSWDF
jgi:catalase